MSVVTHMLQEMEKIEGQNKNIADKILMVNETSQQIEEILTLISNIADKTDILALNASLEGTRAGEAGEGFSLVAMEMRRLAENVSKSAVNIKELIKDIKKAVNSSVMATEEGIRLSQSGVILARDTFTAFENVNQMVEGTSRDIDNIANVTLQQKSNTEQVIKSIAEISGIVGQMASGNKQVAQSILELNQMTSNFKVLVDEFHLQEH